MVAGLLNAAGKAGQYGPRMAGYLQSAANLVKRVMGTPQGRGLLGYGIGYTTADPGQRMQGGIRGGLFGMAVPSRVAGTGFVGNQLGRVPGVTQGVAQNIANVGVPLAAMGVVSGQGTGSPSQAVSGGASQLGGGVRDLAGSQILYNAQGEPVSVYGSSVPQGYGQFGPPGNIPYMSQPWDNIGPLGPLSMNLLMSNRQAQTMADNINVLAPTQMKYAEERSRRELDRQLTAAQVRENIRLAADMTRNQQANALGLGRDAMGGVVDAINRNPHYS